MLTKSTDWQTLKKPARHEGKPANKGAYTDAPKPCFTRFRQRRVLADLIENRFVSMFYIGNNGSFDRLALSCLRDLAQLYPQIDYAVVWERVRTGRADRFDDPSHVLLPDGIDRPNEPPSENAYTYRSRAQ